MKTIRCFLPVVLPLMLFSCARETEYHLYYLGGQSNMDGFGYVEELPAALNMAVQGVYIFHGNPAGDLADEDGRGIWAELAPGHGTGFVSDGQGNSLTGRFGPELTFALELRELKPGERIALVKYSRGGTALDTAARSTYGCWEPDFTEGNGVNQYDHFLNCLNLATSARDIDGDGKTDRLIPSGIIWMQGESDGKTEQAASRYLENLTRLMTLARNALGAGDIPVVIGRISDSGQADDGRVWDFGEQVREAQEIYAARDGNAMLVGSTDNYSYSDPYHYDSPGYIDLGRQFARAVFALEEKNRK